MKTEYTEIQITLLLFTARKNLPLHMQMNSTKLQTHQLLPIVIPWYITSKKGENAGMT